MLTIRDLSAGLQGVMRVVRLDADGLACFDDSPAGFWRSFWVAALLAPLAMVTMLVHAATLEDPEATRYVLLGAIGYVVTWVAFPLAMVYVCDLLERPQRYIRYIVAHNWFRLIEAAMMYPVWLLMTATATDIDAVAFLLMLAMSAVLVYDWFIAKSALDLDGGTAAAVVLIGLLLSLLIDRVVELAA